jgi:hypothetical protein
MLSEGEFSFADLQKDAHARGGSSKASYESPVKSTGDPHGNKREVQQNKENALSSYNNKSNNVAVINSATIDEYKLSAMLGTECKITLMPAHCWKNNKGGKYEYQSDASNTLSLMVVNTSFLPSGLQLITSSVTDYITIKSIGVVQFRVLFSRDSSSGNIESKSSTPLSTNSSSSSNGQLQVVDVNVPASTSSAAFSPSDSNTNSPSNSAKFSTSSMTTIQTPWPCAKVEVMITKRNCDFPLVLNVCTYSSSSIRSSSASTPAKSSRPKNPNKHYEHKN